MALAPGTPVTLASPYGYARDECRHFIPNGRPARVLRSYPGRAVKVAFLRPSLPNEGPPEIEAVMILNEWWLRPTPPDAPSSPVA